MIDVLGVADQEPNPLIKSGRSGDEINGTLTHCLLDRRRVLALGLVADGAHPHRVFLACYKVVHLVSRRVHDAQFLPGL